MQEPCLGAVCILQATLGDVLDKRIVSKGLFEYALSAY